MSSPTFRPDDLTPEASEVRALDRGLLERWNKRQANEFAAVFTEDGSLLGCN